ncbi:Uncharacterised protein [Mycobacteroides abscessus subsp. abscessus]|nr:Uncharacterised protein [Mycobacteroides abscessus subsp. abscessus]
MQLIVAPACASAAMRASSCCASRGMLVSTARGNDAPMR